MEERENKQRSNKTIYKSRNNYIKYCSNFVPGRVFLTWK